jgi:lysophospholipase L1-like esterase
MTQANQPVDASTPAERLDEHFVERHATFLSRIQEGPIGLLFLGDSITRRWVDVLHLWNQYFDKYNPANFGVGGDTIQSLLWRIQNGELDDITPQVIVLLIGTNNAPTNTGEEIASAMRKVVDMIGMKLPETKILLLAIFPRGPQTEDGTSPENPYYMDIVNYVNSELEKLDNSDNIRYLNFGHQFIGADGNIDISLMPDQLHIIEPGYKIWGDTMQPLLEEMMH